MKGLKKFAVLTIGAALILSLCACGGGEEAKKEEKKEVTYESILNDYDAKMKDQSAKLLDEFNKESDGVTDMNELAKLSTKKIEALAKTSVKGTQEMAELMNKNGDDYAVYEEWAGKLNEKYTTYSQQITDAYMAKCGA